MKPSVVVVTYNSGELIADCLRSLLEGEAEADIVVVDNASVDATVEEVSRFPAVRLLAGDVNEGFAAAANRGVSTSTGDPIFLVNPDARPAPDCLPRLLRRLEQPEIGVVGCKILDPDGATLQHVGGRVRRNALTEHIGRGETDRGQYDHLADVAYVTGAVLGIRRATWKELEGLHSGYRPAYFEELELCMRARRLGYRVVVVPEARASHLEAASSAGGPGDPEGEPSGAFYRAYHRNRVLFVARNYSAHDFVRHFLPAEARWLTRRHPRREIVALVRAYVSLLARLPGFLRHRRLRRPTPFGTPRLADDDWKT